MKSMDPVTPLLSGLPASAGRLQVVVGGREVWTLRATAKLRKPGGVLSDVTRSVSATVSYGLNDTTYILRWRNEAISVIPRYFNF